MFNDPGLAVGGEAEKIKENTGEEDRETKRKRTNSRKVKILMVNQLWLWKIDERKLWFGLLSHAC